MGLTGDNSGVLRIFELAKESFFKEIEKIETKKAILSAIIFDDKFIEIIDSKKGKDDVIGTYAMISFADLQNSPLRIYKLNGTEKGQLIREIPNPVNQYCYTNNFYHDEIRWKTCLFFAFDSSFVKMYDLKSGAWIKEFKSETNVSSINFIIRNNVKNIVKIERFIVYTQGNNSIIIADIDNGTIIKQVNLTNIWKVRDLCVWDPLKNNFLIIAAQNQNSLKILNQDLVVIASKEATTNSVPHNLIKILKKDQKTKKIKECIVLCQGEGKDSKILFYE